MADVVKEVCAAAWEQLNAAAQSDSIYQIWRKPYEAAATMFESYANAQPDNVRQMLWQYAESGRLMNQRLTNLACIYMEFPKEREGQ